MPVRVCSRVLGVVLGVVGAGCGGGGSDADAGPDAELLSQAGLYADLASDTLAPGTLEYAPAYPLWTDGAEKRRWIQLPPAPAVIDTSDMDRWVFPVGTRLWKEFSLGGKKLETRLIERTGETSYRFVAFVWNAAGTDAVATTAGATDILGTGHDVPTATQCRTCHLGEPGRVLGFSAVQLSRSGGGGPLAELATQGRLSDAPASEQYVIPAGAAEGGGVWGMLHANCGHCHNPEGMAWSAVGMSLRIRTVDTAPGALATSEAVTTTVGVPTTRYLEGTGMYRVQLGDEAKSAVLQRMMVRGVDQMPPLGTEAVDTTAVDEVKAWINQ